MRQSPVPESDRRRERVLSLAYWILPSTLCLLLYWQGLLAWFQQDDFAWLGLRLDVHNWRDLIWALFTPAAHGTFRPFSERGFFLLFHELFGLHALPFRGWVFLTQFANLVLLSSIVWRVSGSRAAGFWAPIFWCVNANMAVVMTWTSSYMQILCGFCLLLSFHFLLRHFETGAVRYYVLQWLVFLTGFGVMESNLVYPALAAVYTWFCARDHFRKILPLFVPSLLFVILHMMLVPKLAGGPYGIHVDTAIPATLAAYWRLALDPNKVTSFTPFPGLAGATLMILLTVSLLGFVVWQARRRQWVPLVFLCWFGILLSPVVPLRDHISPYYLTLPVIGISALGACAWAHAISARGRGAGLWKTAAVVLGTAFILISAPASYGSVEWWHDRSQSARELLQGVAKAHEIHPDKVILLSGVDNDLFGATFVDHAFRLVGDVTVYLAPGEESRLAAHPEVLDLEAFILPPAITLHALKEEKAVAYVLAEGKLRNVTRTFTARAQALFALQPVRRVNVGEPLFAHRLGPTWHDVEDGRRWMPAQALVVLDGPPLPGTKLYLKGYCPAAQLEAGPLRTQIKMDGEPFPPVFLTEPDAEFDISFPLPDNLVGKNGIEVSIELDRTFSAPNDKRRLGVSFGTLEIR